MISRMSPSLRLAPRRGFTLLELLIAITILASISALVAALWSQTTAWAGENGMTLKTMRLPRVRELMRAQWADRRGAFRLSDSGESVAAEPDKLSFVTATPMLFPDWPLVRAEYSIERDYDTPSGALPAWRLVYTETRLADLSEPPEDAQELINKGMGENVGRYVLLANVASLAFERYGVGDRSIRKKGSLVEPEDPEAKSTDLQSLTQNHTPDKDEDEEKWRPFEQKFDGLIPAVRVVGEFQDEAFSCVFVITGSR